MTFERIFYHGIVFRWLIFGTKSEGLSGNTIPHSQHLFHFVSCNYLFNCTIFQFNPHCATNVLRCYKVESTFFGLVTQLDQTRASLLTRVITLDILEGFSVANFIIFGVLCNILANHLPECSTKPHLGLAPLEITLSSIFRLFSPIKPYQIPSFITLKYKSSDLLTLKKKWFIRFLKQLLIYHKENSLKIVELFSISQDWPRSRKSMQAEEEDSSKNKQNFKDWKKPRHSRRSSSHRGVLTVIEGVLASLKPRPASGMAAWPSRAVVAKV